MTERGYTLIEIVVVMLLIGIAVGVTLPKVQDTLAGDRLKKSARLLTILSREMRSDAVREQVDYELHIDLLRKCFWRYSVDTTDEKRKEIQKRPIQLPEGVSIPDIQRYGEDKQQRGEAVIRFFKGGYMQPAVIHLADGDKRMTLVFGPFVPRVKIHEAYVDVWRTDSPAAGAGG